MTRYVVLRIEGRFEPPDDRRCRGAIPPTVSADVCVTVLNTSFISSSSSPFGRLPSAIVQHVRRIRVLDAILFCYRLLPFHLLAVYSLLHFRRRLDVHLS